MPPFWKRPEPKKPEPMKPEPSAEHKNLQHTQEHSEHLPGQAHKRTRKEIQLEAFSLDGEAHRLVNEYMALQVKHGSDAKIPQDALQGLHRQADIIRARQEAIRKEYEESS
jgi:hypothetical protein